MEHFRCVAMFSLIFAAVFTNNIRHVRARETARGHRYLYLVESVRDGGRVRQQIVRALGRKDVLPASGELDRLVASLARATASGR